ncbi:pyridoxal phosphate-dependent transferase [Mycena capillaripes]|nr:pyridoxal phosphate-dependent transferase [Mycena capillaripes]
MRQLPLDFLNPQLLGKFVEKERAYPDQAKSDSEGNCTSLHFNQNIISPDEGLHQPPITFTRQVAALTEWPALSDLAPGVFPADVVARAKELYNEIGSIGAYAHNQGVPLIRGSVAKFIEGGISLLINLLITDPTAGILIPIPKHPLYVAILEKHHGRAIPYLLDESDTQTISSTIAAARKADTKPKALVVINPGSRTSALLTSSTMEALVRICEQNDLVLLADEVYQNDVYPGHQQFTSFKKVLRDLNSPVPLVSFHSISKGVSGECGRRGGYFELCNISPDVVALIFRLVSAGLDPPVSGQIAVDSMVRSPKEGEPSYVLWKAVTDTIRNAQREKTKIMGNEFPSFSGEKVSVELSRSLNFGD